MAQVPAAIAASALFGLGLAQSGDPLIVAGAIVAFGLLALGLLRPASFLLLFLLVRPLLDEVSDVNLGIPGTNLAGGLALFLVLMAVLLVLQRRSTTVVTPSAIAFAAIAAVTTGASVLAIMNFGGTVGGDPVSEAIRVICILTMPLLAANVLNTPDRLRKLVVVAGLSGVIPALWGIIELPFLEAPAGEDIARISGSFTGPNPLSQYLAVTALILIAMPRDYLSTRVRIAALVPQLVAIVPTYSRVGWFMLIVGVALLTWREHKRVVVAMVVVVAAVVSLVPAVNNRVLPSSTPTPGSAPTYESYGWRVENWRTLLQEWKDQPFVGYGTGTTIYVNPRRPVLKEETPDGGFEAHNLVVRILVEGGIALLVVYIGFGIVIALSMRSILQRRWEFHPVARLVAILWVLMLLVGLLTDDPFGNTAVLFTVIALTGALESTYRRARASQPDAAGMSASPMSLPARPRT